MPNRWPINSGSWSDSAIWSGSLIPTASDDVFANNQTINVVFDDIRTVTFVNANTILVSGSFTATANLVTTILQKVE
jgi:hypothetical protein